jgi:hypothetical protein
LGIIIYYYSKSYVTKHVFILSSWKGKHAQKGTQADGAHAASWATCVGPGTCNLTQRLSRGGGSSSILSVSCLNRESLGGPPLLHPCCQFPDPLSENCFPLLWNLCCFYPHAILRTKTGELFCVFCGTRHWGNRLSMLCLASGHCHFRTYAHLLLRLSSLHE